MQQRWLKLRCQVLQLKLAVPCNCANNIDWVMLPLVAINIEWVLLLLYRLPWRHLWWCIGFFPKVILHSVKSFLHLQLYTKSFTSLCSAGTWPISGLVTTEKEWCASVARLASWCIPIIHCAVDQFYKHILEQTPFLFACAAPTCCSVVWFVTCFGCLS